MCVAGHPDALMLGTEVMFHREQAQSFLNVMCVVWHKGMDAKELMWETPRLQIGDEVLIKLVDGVVPDAANWEWPYGMRQPPPWGDDTAQCSFCGANPADRRAMFDGYKVRICAECVEFRHRIIHAPKGDAT